MRKTRGSSLSAALLLGTLLSTPLVVLAACEREAPPEPPAAATKAAPLDDEEEELDEHGQDALELDSPAAERPVEALSEEELEAACFRGRRDACDLLGH